MFVIGFSIGKVENFMMRYLTTIVLVASYFLSTTSAAHKNMQVSPRPTEDSNEIWHKLFNMQEQLNVIQKDNGNLRVQLAEMGNRLNLIQRENEDLKKNQSVLTLEIDYLKNTCISGNISSVSTSDSETISNHKIRLDELEGNQTANLNLHSTLNASIESLKFLQKASAGVVSSLQGEQIKSNLLITALQSNLSNAETQLESMITTLNNTLVASRKASAVALSSLEGEQIISQLLMSDLQHNLSNVEINLESRLKNLNKSLLAFQISSAADVSSLQHEQATSEKLISSLQQNLSNSYTMLGLSLRTLNTSIQSSLQSKYRIYLNYYYLFIHSLYSFFLSDHICFL